MKVVIYCRPIYIPFIKIRAKLYYNSSRIFFQVTKIYNKEVCPFLSEAEYAPPSKYPGWVRVRL